MESKSVNFNVSCVHLQDLYDTSLETFAKWLSCNGEVWGVGPTAVFASAAALFLYNEMEATLFIPGDQAQVSLPEKTLISTMMFGMLALMIHLWVCTTRFFQYYLETIIKDSPNVLLEMTTASLLGSSNEVPLGPLTRFLRQQQPQIHITVCWFLSLCYADYVRKNYCHSFNMPYLEQWQTELHERVTRSVHHVLEKVHTFVGSVHQRIRGFGSPTLASGTEQPLTLQILVGKRSSRVRARPRNVRRSMSDEPLSHLERNEIMQLLNSRLKSSPSVSSVSRVKQLLTRLKGSEITSRKQDAPALLYRTRAVLSLTPPATKKPLDEFPWRHMEPLPLD